MTMELNVANEIQVEAIGWDPTNWHAQFALGPSPFSICNAALMARVPVAI